MKQGIFGVIIAMIGLWGGCWAFYKFGTMWQGLPSVMTACALVLLGIFLAVFGFSREFENK